MATTTNALTSNAAGTVPCDNEQVAFMTERLQGTRISIRIGKSALFITFNEADQVVEAITRLMVRTASQPATRTRL